jgi:hypothetical protein
VAVQTVDGERVWAYQWGWTMNGLVRIDRWDRRDEA